MTQNFHVLSKITAEPPALPPVEHAGAHILNAPLFERKHARVYLGDQESREAIALRRQIAKGAREALEEQYWDVLERTVQARPAEARLGGDPSIANKVRAFLFVRYYRNGEWEDRIEVRYVLFNGGFYWLNYDLARSWTTVVGKTILPCTHRPYARSLGRSTAIPASNRAQRGELRQSLSNMDRITGSKVFYSNSRVLLCPDFFEDCPRQIGIICRLYTMLTCCIQLRQILSNLRCTN